MFPPKLPARQSTRAFTLGLTIVFTMVAAAEVELSDSMIGRDRFEVPDATPVEARSGEIGFDVVIPVLPGESAHGASPSRWSVASGSLEAAIESGRLGLRGRVERPFSASISGASLVAADRARSVVYLGVRMTRQTGATYSGIATLSGEEVQMFAGVFNDGDRAFGIRPSGETPSEVPPDAVVASPGVEQLLVLKVDTAAELCTLYVDPQLGQAEATQSVAATYAFPAGESVEGLALVCGNSGGVPATFFDDVVAAFEWDGVAAALGPPVAADDAVAMRPAGKLLFEVLANDHGVIDPASVEIVTPPLAGTAEVDRSGRVRYHHGGGGAATDALEYRVADDTGGFSTSGTLALEFVGEGRLPLSTARVPDPPQEAEGFELVNALPGLSFLFACALDFIPGDDDGLVVGTQDGKLHRIVGYGGSEPVAEVLFDLVGMLDARSGEAFYQLGENGLKSFAFHPGYASNGRVYVAYTVNKGGFRKARLSCFLRSTTDPDVLDPGSEDILIETSFDQRHHTIDDLVFGNDGFLYLSFGDDASNLPSPGSDLDAQTIERDFWGGIIRIDVDLQSGSLEPKDSGSIVLGGDGKAKYRVPADNPFVGATQFNGETLDPDKVRTEFYAVGFRNPWQISIDAETGELWVGDVGWNDMEEINRVVPGGNYGWPHFEGTLPGRGTPPASWNPLAPTYSYPHGNGTFEGNAVTGGIRYRGVAYPELEGLFVFADFSDGHLWALDPDTDEIERLAGMLEPVCFEIDPGSEEILIASYNGRIYRLTRAGATGDFPERLSDTGLFADLSDLSPNPGLVPYEPNLTFWSDHAIKSRFFGIPETEPTIGFAVEGGWDYPAGMLWVKHFEMELRRGDPSSLVRLETRVLKRTEEAAFGVSYRWNDSGTEAFLVDEVGEAFDLTIDEGGWSTTQTWTIPSRAQCMVCHQEGEGYSLSFRTRQLNRDGWLGTQDGNFVELLELAGYLEGLGGSAASLPRHLKPDEDDYSLEARARSWLAVNCSYCHRDQGSAGRAEWNGRALPTLDETGLIDVVPIGTRVDQADRLLVAGNADRSVLVRRAEGSGGYERMPPLATEVVDAAGVALLRDWIDQEMRVTRDYQGWREAEFGSTATIIGEPDFDADQDGRDNHFEWLTRTGPLDAGDSWRPRMWIEDGRVHFDFPGLGDRRVVILRSRDLSAWEPWRVPGNDGIPRNPSILHQLSAPTLGGGEFFSFEVKEW